MAIFDGDIAKHVDNMYLTLSFAMPHLASTRVPHVSIAMSRYIDGDSVVQGTANYYDFIDMPVPVPGMSVINYAMTVAAALVAVAPTGVLQPWLSADNPAVVPALIPSGLDVDPLNP
jgi:hypothetical protein